jgi:hypothetical protein
MSIRGVSTGLLYNMGLQQPLVELSHRLRLPHGEGGAPQRGHGASVREWPQRAGVRHASAPNPPTAGAGVAAGWSCARCSRLGPGARRALQQAGAAPVAAGWGPGPGERAPASLSPGGGRGAVPWSRGPPAEGASHGTSPPRRTPRPDARPPPAPARAHSGCHARLRPFANWMLRII